MYNKICVSIIPLLMIIFVSNFDANNTKLETTEAASEINIDHELMRSLIDKYGDNISVCSDQTEEYLEDEFFTCPCGGNCESEPGGVCAVCSEWETQAKFKPCAKKPDHL
jgi:hypothetical protein